MSVQIRFIAENNWLHHTTGNNAPLAIVVLTATSRERSSCHESNTEKNVCKAKFKNQNHDLSTENRRKYELGSSFMIVLNVSAKGMEDTTGGLKPFQKTWCSCPVQLPT